MDESRIMKKLLNLTFCLSLLFMTANFAQSQTAKQTKLKASANKKAKNIKSAKSKNKPKRIEVPIRDPINVSFLELSQNEIILNCPPSNVPCPNNRIIKVRTIANDNGDGGVKYEYTVSVVKIIGEGANVSWDLSDAKPGNYTITAGVSQPVFNGTQWMVLGRTQTGVVVIKE